MRWMMMSCLLLGSSWLLALDEPVQSFRDSRIQMVDYNEFDVVELNTYPGVATQIILNADEEILDIASGFTQGWTISYRRHYIYLKPQSITDDTGLLMEPEPGVWDTNLIVTTSKRVYTFQLILQPTKSGNKLSYHPKVAFRLSFNYPDEKTTATETPSRLATSEVLTTRPQNWQYTLKIGKHSKHILPTMAYDDGQMTYFTFPNQREIPAVFLRDEEDNESIVDHHMVGDTMVVHRLSKVFTFRLGEAVVTVTNEAYDPDGLPTRRGTTQPYQERVMIENGEVVP